MTRPPSENPPQDEALPAPTAVAVATPGADAVAGPGAEATGRRRLLIRLAAAVVAAALLVTLAVLVLSGRTTERSAEAYCSRLAGTGDIGEVLATGSPADIEAAAGGLQSAARVAPPEIEPAMTLYADYATQLGRAVADAGPDEASIAAALTAAVVAQNDRADQVAAAVGDVDTYVAGTCGFALTPATDPTTPGDGG